MKCHRGPRACPLLKCLVHQIKQPLGKVQPLCYLLYQIAACVIKHITLITKNTQRCEGSSGSTATAQCGSLQGSMLLGNTAASVRRPLPGPAHCSDSASIVRVHGAVCLRRAATRIPPGGTTVWPAVPACRPLAQSFMKPLQPKQKPKTPHFPEEPSPPSLWAFT